MHKLLSKFFLLFLTSIVTAYGATEEFAPPIGNYASYNKHCQVYDPYEGLNRKVFIFNGMLDGVISAPIARLYDKGTNVYIKDRVGSFTANIKTPLSMVNYGLQGKAEGIFKGFWRFIINSTFGVLGLFDVASKVDLSLKPQTFGDTMAYYSMGPGPYVVLPIFGGMSMRDVPDALMLNTALNPVKYPMHGSFKNYLTAADIIHNRAAILPFTDHVTAHSLDPYITIRDAIWQHRETRLVYPQGFICPKR